jgi:hypothetical protein
MDEEEKMVFLLVLKIISRPQPAEILPSPLSAKPQVNPTESLPTLTLRLLRQFNDLRPQHNTTQPTNHQHDTVAS